MAATLENISQLERRINISLPSQEIDSEVQARLKKLARDVKMHGFRPGKVPLKVVAQQYAEQVRREVLGDALQKSFGDAVRAQNLKVAGYPRFEPKGELGSVAHVEFSATFEIYPEVTASDMSKVVIRRPQTERQRSRGRQDARDHAQAARELRSGHAAGGTGRQGCHRLSWAKPTVASSTAVRAEDFSLTLGEGRLLKDFEHEVVGLKAGDSKAFEIRFPEDYHGKELAGKTATFDVKLKQVAGPRLPPVDADFARALGVADGNLETMRREVRENLEREVKRRISARVKDQIMQALIDTTKVEVPKSLVELEIERMQGAAQQDLAARGVKAQGMQLPRDLFEQQAQRRVALGLILAEVVKTHALQAKPDQVRAAVEEQSQSYEQPAEVVKWYYQSPERLREIESMVIEENVVAWALATAQVEDKATDFDELMGNSK